MAQQNEGNGEELTATEAHCSKTTLYISPAISLNRETMEEGDHSIC